MQLFVEVQLSASLVYLEQPAGVVIVPNPTWKACEHIVCRSLDCFGRRQGHPQESHADTGGGTPAVLSDLLAERKGPGQGLAQTELLEERHRGGSRVLTSDAARHAFQDTEGKHRTPGRLGMQLRGAAGQYRLGLTRPRLGEFGLRAGQSGRAVQLAANRRPCIVGIDLRLACLSCVEREALTGEAQA